MHLFRWQTEEKGEKHLSKKEMRDLYKEYHSLLQETYFDHVANQRICEEAMSSLHNIHICKKHGSFLLNFVCLLRDVYSHAHYNVYELMYTDSSKRQSERMKYWEEISHLFDKIIESMDHIWTSPSSPQRLSIILSYATLYSLFKDMAEEQVIEYCFRLAEEAYYCETKKKDSAEMEQIHEYYEAIQLIYIMRSSLPKVRAAGVLNNTERVIKAVKIHPLPQHQSSEESVVKEEIEEKEEFSDNTPRLHSQRNRFANKQEMFYGMTNNHDDFYGEAMEMDTDEIRIYVPQMVQTTERVEDILGLECTEWIDNLSTEIFTEAVSVAHSIIRHRYPRRSVHKYYDDEPEELQFGSPPTRRPSLPHTSQASFYISNSSNTDMMRRLSLKPSSSEDKMEESHNVLEPFDPLQVFEQRLGGSRKMSPPSMSEPPVICKPTDLVNSFRRKALFDTPREHAFVRGTEKKRTSESEWEARDSKGPRTGTVDGEMSEAIDISNEDKECVTPSNTPFEVDMRDTREIDSGVFEGICIPRRECETPSNTPMVVGINWQESLDQRSLQRELEDTIVRAVVNETPMKMTPNHTHYNY